MNRPRRAGLVVSAPALILFGVFMFYPITSNLVTSFTSSRGALYEFRQLISRPAFGYAVTNTFRWVVISTTADLVIGFFLALLIVMYIKHGSSIYRAVFFMPMVVTPTVIGLVFTTLYAPDYGPIYGVARSLGLSEHFPALLENPATVTYALIAINVWQWLGWFVLLYSVALVQIPRELLEAASIDGVSGPRLWFRILVPLVRPTTLTLIVFGIIESLQQFAIVYVTTDGGPGNVSQVMGSYVYRLAFVDNRPGEAAALAVFLFATAAFLIGGVLVLARGRFTIRTGNVA